MDATTRAVLSAFVAAIPLAAQVQSEDAATDHVSLAPAKSYNAKWMHVKRWRRSWEPHLVRKAMGFLSEVASEIRRPLAPPLAPSLTADKGGILIGPHALASRVDLLIVQLQPSGAPGGDFSLRRCRLQLVTSPVSGLESSPLASSAQRATTKLEAANAGGLKAILQSKLNSGTNPTCSSGPL
jgi:hypothetical protein